MTLGGLVLIRNGITLDYNFEEAIQSLLPVCEVIVACDGESTDGTQEKLREWAAREPKLKICVYPWPNPVGNPDFYVEWIQYGRMHVPADLVCHLDADEVLFDSSYEEIRAWKGRPGRFSLWCDRLNFWADHRHTIPHGVCLSHRVVRLLPQDVWLPSDGPHPKGAEATGMAQHSGITIGHYGFLRRREAYFAKSKELHRMFFDTYDQRLVDAETKGGNWMREIGGIEWTGNLDDYKGEHPEVIRQWLRDRGYTL